MTLAGRSGAVALGLLADRALGEPPAALHPVAAFGAAMGVVEGALWRDDPTAGARYAAAGLALGWAAGRAVGSTAAATYVVVAGRQLRRTAADIAALAAAGDLEAARAALPALVGRDPTGFDASQVAAAVVESLAENTVDAVVAPALWAVAAGAPGAAAYRALNTMDAMVGHRSERYRRFGTAAARLDDAANWIPARATAAAVAAVRPHRARAVWTAVRRDAPAHPSPNAGVAEAAVAGALGVELGGPLRYGDRSEDRPRLGSGPRPQPTDVAAALRLVDDVERLLVATLAAGAVRGLGRRIRGSPPVTGDPLRAWDRPARDRPVGELPAGAHGGDAGALARRYGIDPATVLDLSLSLNPLAPDLGPLLARHLDAHRRYPDDRPATAALATALDVDPDRVVLTNGGAEAIALVARMRPVGRVDEPEFSLYRDHLAEVRSDGPRWMSDPHNPTGRLARPDERASVRDEAFYALATGRWSRHDPETVVVGSLTKVFACPGLRIGYVLAPDPAGATSIRRHRPAWSLNGIAAAVVPELLAAADLPGWATGVATLRAELVTLLRRHGLAPVPSDANYVWIPDAPGLRARLWPHGVLVRAGTSFGYPDAVRIAVPPPEALARVATALDRSHP